jgi:ATP-binding cassette, subfamily C, bacterial CydC
MRDVLRLFGLFRPQLGWLLVGALLSLVTLLANISLMGLSGWFITTMALAGVTGITVNYFTPAAFIRGLAIVRTAGRYGERLVTHDATLRVLSDIRVWFYRSLEPLAPARLNVWRSGDLLNRIQADIDALDSFYINTWIPLFSAVVAILAVTVFVGVFSGPFAFALFVLLIIGGFILPMIGYVAGKKAVSRELVVKAELRNTILDSVSGMAELRVYGAQGAQQERLAKEQSDLLVSQQHINRIDALNQAGMGSLGQIAVWLALLITIPLVGAQELNGAHLGMLVLLAQASFECVAPMPLAFQTFGRSMSAARRLFELVDATPLVTEPDRPLPVPMQPSISFDHVSLTYPGQGHAALQDISFSVAPGERVAVVGVSGSGKSSLMQLLLRFYEPSSGAVMIDDHAIQDYESGALRECYSVASQFTHLFNTTVRANLMMARPHASEEAMIEAAKRARLHGEIMALPEGYDSFVGEAGVRLSGGQQRRMTLARAFLRDARILLLDEPTEGLDLENERMIMDILAQEFADRSLILITHRLTGLESMDRILVLEQGRMVEQGNHQSLLAAGGRYAAFRQILDQ